MFQNKARLLFLLLLASGQSFGDTLDNRVTAAYFDLNESSESYFDSDIPAKVKFASDGSGVLMWNIEEQGMYMQEIGEDMILIPGTLQKFPDQNFLDFVVHDNQYITILTRRQEGLGRLNREYYQEFMDDSVKNVLEVVKMDRKGREVFRTPLVGHNGVGRDAFFLCSMIAEGNIDFDGVRYSVYSPVCKNWGTDTAPDIHEGDVYFQLDKNGTIVMEQIWGASHSSLLKQVMTDNGLTYTATVGDGSPYGIQFRGYNYEWPLFMEIPWPDQDRLPYDDMYEVSLTTTDAGEIGNILVIDQNIITVAATIETESQPILYQNKDLLFIKINASGETEQLRWLDQTDMLDESMPYIMPYGENILMVYYVSSEPLATDGNAVLAVIDREGRYVEGPVETQYLLNWQSHFFTFPNGDIGWIFLRVNYSPQVIWFRVALP